MPTKPARPKSAPQQAAPPAAEQQPSFAERQAARDAKRQAQFNAVSPLVTNLTSYKLDDLITFKLILDRGRGSATPIEEFIEDLISMYRCEEERGLGLTLEYIEQGMAQLRKDFASTIEESRYIAGRYPQQEEPVE